LALYSNQSPLLDAWRYYHSNHKYAAERSCAGSAGNQYEIESLYKRFRSLDRGRKGYISAEELMSIPELSINPLAQRLVRGCLQELQQQQQR
jgi:Ca2+-binding EF-hand superfamily protein